MLRSDMPWYYLRLAWVDVRRSPWLTVLIVLTLAVGLMASMSTLALRHALTGDPIPSKSARLFTLQGSADGGSGHGLFSYSQAQTLSRLGGSYATGVISGEVVTRSIGTEDKVQHFDRGVGIRYTTANFFSVFDAPLKSGRTWTHQEQLNAAPVMVIDAGMADALFPNGNALGKKVRLGNVLYTIVGTLTSWHPQPRYYDINSPSGAFGSGGDAIYLPYTTVQYAPAHSVTNMRCPHMDSASPIAAVHQLPSSTCQWLSMWYLARTSEGAAKLKDTLPVQLTQILPKARTKHLELLDVRQILSRANLVPASLRTYLLLGLAFLALCVINASGMQLSRALRRTSAIGVRRALGARRSDIVLQHLCESLLIGTAGGAAGIALTYIALGLIRHIPERYIIYSHMANVDGHMLVLMVAVALSCSILAGLVPALIASRADPALAIKDVE